jgi:UDP-glucose 4-epimerase
LQTAPDNLFLNLGTGQGYSVREVISMVGQVSGRTVDARMVPRRAGDPPALVAAPGLAQATLGWQPAHSSLRTIIETALRWHETGMQFAPGNSGQEATTPG